MESRDSPSRTSRLSRECAHTTRLRRSPTPPSFRSCAVCAAVIVVVIVARTNTGEKKFTASATSLDALSAGVACTARLRQYSLHAGRERGRGKTRGANVKMPAGVVRALPASLFQTLSLFRYSTSDIRTHVYLRGNFRNDKLAHSLLNGNHTRGRLSLSLLSSYLPSAVPRIVLAVAYRLLSPRARASRFDAGSPRRPTSHRTKRKDRRYIPHVTISPSDRACHGGG